MDGVDFDEKTFFPQYRSDLASSRGLAIIQTGFLGRYRLEQEESYIRSCLNRGVCVCVFVQEPDPQNRDIFDTLAKRLVSWGAHVNLRPDIHYKRAFIDDRIFYRGSLNVLSHYRTAEEMTRYELSSERIRELIRAFKLDTCDTCRANGVRLLDPQNAGSRIGAAIKTARTKAGLTQRELAGKSGLQQRLISELERGERNLRLETLDKLCEIIASEPRIIPWYLIPKIDQLLMNCLELPDMHTDLPPKKPLC